MQSLAHAVSHCSAALLCMRSFHCMHEATKAASIGSSPATIGTRHVQCNQACSGSMHVSRSSLLRGQDRGVSMARSHRGCSSEGVRGCCLLLIWFCNARAGALLPCRWRCASTRCWRTTYWHRLVGTAGGLVLLGRQLLWWGGMPPAEHVCWLDISSAYELSRQILCSTALCFGVLQLKSNMTPRAQGGKRYVGMDNPCTR